MWDDSYLNGGGVAEIWPGPEELPKLAILSDDELAGMRPIDRKTGGFSTGSRYLKVLVAVKTFDACTKP